MHMPREVGGAVVPGPAAFLAVGNVSQCSWPGTRAILWQPVITPYKSLSCWNPGEILICAAQTFLHV